jgi:hypothetical protein
VIRIPNAFGKTPHAAFTSLLDIAVAANPPTKMLITAETTQASSDGCLSGMS